MLRGHVVASGLGLINFLGSAYDRLARPPQRLGTDGARLKSMDAWVEPIDWPVMLAIAWVLLAIGVVLAWRYRTALQTQWLVGLTWFAATLAGCWSIIALVHRMQQGGLAEARWAPVVLSLGLSALVLLLASAYRRFRVAWAYGGIWALALIFIARLLLNPAVLWYEFSKTLIFNELTVIYLPAALALMLVGREFGLAGRKVDRHVMEAIALLASFWFITLEVRHGALTIAQPYEDIFMPYIELNFAFGPITLLEIGAYGAAWLLWAIAVLSVRLVWRRPMLTAGGVFVSMLGGVFCLIVLGLESNPMYRPVYFGTMSSQSVLLGVYGGAIVAFVLLTLLLRLLNQRRGAIATGAVALFMVLMLATLEIRLALNPAAMTWKSRPAEGWELAAYVGGWLVVVTVVYYAIVWRRRAMLTRPTATTGEEQPV